MLPFFTNHCGNDIDQKLDWWLYNINFQAADDLEKEVKQLSELNPHKRVVTYLGACYADHPRFKEKCLYVFTEYMAGVSYVMLNPCICIIIIQVQ